MGRGGELTFVTGCFQRGRLCHIVHSFVVEHDQQASTFTVEIASQAGRPRRARGAACTAVVRAGHEVRASVRTCALTVLAERLLGAFLTAATDRLSSVPEREAQLTRNCCCRSLCRSGRLRDLKGNSSCPGSTIPRSKTGYLLQYEHLTETAFTTRISRNAQWLSSSRYTRHRSNRAPLGITCRIHRKC